MTQILQWGVNVARARRFLASAEGATYPGGAKAWTHRGVPPARPGIALSSQERFPHCRSTVGHCVVDRTSVTGDIPLGLSNLRVASAAHSARALNSSRNASSIVIRKTSRSTVPSIGNLLRQSRPQRRAVSYKKYSIFFENFY